MATDKSGTSNRVSGTVHRILGGYGFFSRDEGEPDVYFKVEWFVGNPPLQVGDRVEFGVREYGSNLQAFAITREGESHTSTRQLYEWAYLGNVPTLLNALANIALDERWEFQNVAVDPDKPLPILHNYLVHTFGRLHLTEQVAYDETRSWAAFNTGLVDVRYEPIYAVFSANTGHLQPWRFSGFCIRGEGPVGQNLVRHFNSPPARADYFDNPIDLLYDVREGAPELDLDHIIVERISRYPQDFLQEFLPDDETSPTGQGNGLETPAEFYRKLGERIKNDDRVYRRITSHVRNSINLSIKRVTWNFKTAVPQYYPRTQQLQLLLPLCLVSDNQVDLALAVEKTPSGKYLGHTVLPLDWAYMNARLLCRPDSDWLQPGQIFQHNEGDDDVE